MKSALKRLFVLHPIHHKADNIQEEAFYSKKCNQYYKKNKVHSSYRKPNNKPNPPNNKSQALRCVMCDFKMYWANNCPRNTQSMDSYLPSTFWNRTQHIAMLGPKSPLMELTLLQ